MTDTVISFPAPAPLLNMNQRLHWTVQRRRAREWRTAATVAALQQLGPGPTRIARPPSYVTVTLPVRDRRRRDPANFFPVTKHCVDGLVSAGVWPDDDPTWVTVIEPVLAVGAHLVTITLTPRETT